MIPIVRKYPFSLLIILTVIYLSFFKPPATPLDQVQNFDKLVHFSMYFGLAGVLWLEYMKSHKKNFRLKNIVFIAVVFPITFSGSIELLQEYCTTYRSGDWLDFTANSIGAITAGIVAYYFVKPRFF